MTIRTGILCLRRSTCVRECTVLLHLVTGANLHWVRNGGDINRTAKYTWFFLKQNIRKSGHRYCGAGNAHSFQKTRKKITPFAEFMISFWKRVLRAVDVEWNNTSFMTSQYNIFGAK